MPPKSEISIDSIPLIEISGETNIPTVSYYQDKDAPPLIGYEALKERSDRTGLQQDFKVEVGNHDPSRQKGNATFLTASGVRKSAAVIASDFIFEVLKEVDQWLQKNNISEASHILFAEPLAIHTDDDKSWLANYRKNISEMLKNRKQKEFPNLQFTTVEFLPEPFAVYQYYRYERRWAALLEKKKKKALVIDFGGGTFDICIIETTKDGQISSGGKNSVPLGANSIKVGGFQINRELALYLFQEHLNTSKKKRDQFKKGREWYRKWIAEEADLEDLRPDLRNYASNFHKVVVAMEKVKIRLSRSIRNWSLDATLHQSEKIDIPDDPFQENPRWKTVSISAKEFREIFDKKIWRAHLKSAVQRAIDRGSLSNLEHPIDVVLMSGGSSNIKWLSQYLKEDFNDALENADLVMINDFQEVVSKGLAAECARRFYTDDKQGDFGSVIYNDLCLVLRTGEPNQGLNEYKNIGGEIAAKLEPGVLIPASTQLKPIYDRPIVWRVKGLKKEPKHIEYYFLRGSTDLNEADNRLNFAHTRVDAPKDCQFDHAPKIELTIRKDGTAVPNFIYRSDNRQKGGRPQQSQEGEPFYIDQTHTEGAEGVRAYIGFDFGTSNSSVSFVRHEDLEEIRVKSEDRSWGELRDIYRELPFPASEPIASYLQAGIRSQEEATNLGRAALEAVLAVCGYFAYADYCQYRSRLEQPKDSAIFSTLTQRSLGPLWVLLKSLFGPEGISFTQKATFSKPISQLFQGDVFKQLERSTTELAEHKHEKRDAVDTNTPLYIAANILRQVCSTNKFGFFEQMEQDPYSSIFKGYFQIVHGPSSFCEFLCVEAETPVPPRTPYLLSRDDSTAIPLRPLFYWQQVSGGNDNHGSCFVYDFYSKRDTEVTFKEVGRRNSETIGLEHQHAPLLTMVQNLFEKDGIWNPVKVSVIEESVEFE
jgi:hypothetical protein